MSVRGPLATVTTSHPCPPWCRESVGHPYEVDGVNDPERWHRALVGRIELTQLDVVLIDDDGVRMQTDGVRVCVHDPNPRGGGAVDLRPEDLASLLPDLQRALSLLTNGEQWTEDQL